MSDQNPPEQGAFGSPPPGSDPAGPGPGASPAGGSTPPPPPPPVTPSGPSAPAPQPDQPGHPTTASSAMSSSVGAITDSSTGFFPALFDFSFNTFVTPKIVRFVYVLAAIWVAIVYVIAVITGFTQSVGSGLAALIFGPILAIIWLAIVRIGLEFGISVVRMSEDVHKRLPQA